MPEGVVRAEYSGVPCQIRMDWFSGKYELVDLKTCDSLKWFESDCRRFGYLFQMAFYRAVIREATGIAVPVHIVAVEKNEPFSTGVWKLTDEVLELAELGNKAALERYRNCRASGVWPTGYEEVRIIDTL
ncbi:MAG: PD-(D/E)XK nuclease-like domain-containing protein [Victivallales bacterium]|nr:PD-(D/E)XK nuclease-like domain-containing protein [Victivallales bacterium]